MFSGRARFAVRAYRNAIAVVPVKRKLSSTMFRVPLHLSHSYGPSENEVTSADAVASAEHIGSCILTRGSVYECRCPRDRQLTDAIPPSSMISLILGIGMITI